MNRLRELRTAAGLTQAQVAERLGVEQSFYSRVERGDGKDGRRLSDRYVWKLAEILRCHPGELFAPLPAPSEPEAEAMRLARALEPARREQWLAIGRSLATNIVG